MFLEHGLLGLSAFARPILTKRASQDEVCAGGVKSTRPRPPLWLDEGGVGGGVKRPKRAYGLAWGLAGHPGGDRDG